MAVETDFAATLLSNLKLEDPWLPPSSWESIPSESGRRFPPPLSSSDHRPNHQVSSVSEASMVRLAVNALQGVESALISIEKISTAFFSDPADRTFHRIPSLWNRCSSTHAQGKILKSIGRSGFLVFLLCRFVDYFRNSNLGDKILGIQDYHDDKVQEEEHPPYSLVNHAFSVAVGKVIEGYICALDTLYASVHLRHSSDRAESPLEACSSVGCLTTVVHSETTLLELYLHTKELRNQIEALGNICNLCTVALSYTESSVEDLLAKSMLEFRSFFRGGELLTYLYTQLQVADPPHHALLKFLFLRSCEPYCGFIRSWIYKAEISDPYKEFVVEHNDCSPFHGHGKADTSSDFPIASIRVRDGVALPCFLKDYLIPLVRSGQQLQVLMKLLEFCTYVAAEDLTFEDLLPNWNGSFGDNSAIAFPITFEKNEIEARVLERGSYYKRMQEKLETLLTKLVFRYQQVISHDTTLNGIGNGWRSSILIAPTSEDKGDGDDVCSEDSCTVDDLPYSCSTHESSECSLSANSEEGTLSDHLIDLSGHMVGNDQKYLSALSFSTGPLHNTLQEKPNEYEELHNVGSDPDGICEGREAVYNYQQSKFNERLLDQIITPVESEDPNWPVSGLYKSSRSNPHDCHPKVCKLGALKEGLSYYRKMVVTDDTMPEELFSKDQQAYMTHESDLFTLKDWQVTSDNNFLSLNPMLTKNSFPELRTDHRQRDGIRAQSLPYYDFSSVEDACKASMDKISVRFMDSSASTPGIKSNPRDKDKHGQDTLIKRTKTCDFTSFPEPKAYNRGDTMPPNVSGGSSWESSLASSTNTVINCAGDSREISLAKFDIPLDFIIDKCLQQEIMLQYKYISKLTIKLLEEGFDFKEHLLALRRYHFMELADWADLFIISLSNHKWCITEAEQRLAEIQGFLEISIQRSSCEYDHNKDRLYVYMKGNDTLPLTTSAIGLHSFDFLGLGYRVDWPVSIVLTAGALKIYSEIFSFLIKVKLAIFSLTDVWCSLKELRPLIGLNQHVEQREKEVRHFNLLMKMRHQVNHFVSTLQQHVESQLSHVSWYRFLHSLQHKVKDMMDLESVHMAYLIDSLHICFLSEETQHVARIIDGILQCALDLRFALKGGIWDVGINQGDVAGRLSKINISKVFTIKKTFDKNLKELHLHHLKSPKHSNYGLSRFWGHLNYNEHYSDIGSERRNYAFSL